MNDYSNHTRNLVSTWFSLIFFFLLMGHLVSIEIFRENKAQKSIVSLLETPLRSDFLDNVIGIRFKNRIGSYTIKKENNTWILQEPRVIPAQQKTIQKILSALKSIKVRTIHQLEPINFQSFSLDRPIINLELVDKLDERIEIKVGLINPINNTSYITVSGKDHIFQTNLFEGKLEGLEFSDFIDGNVFSIPIEAISEFSLYLNNDSVSRNTFTQENEFWTSKKFKSIDQKKVGQKIQQILNTKTHMILDEVDEELRNFINNYTTRPLYRIKIKTNTGQIIQYKITSLVKAIKSLKIEKRQYFIMQASDRPYPYIISKSYLENFLIRYKEIR